MAIEWQEVESSNIAEIGYWEKEKEPLVRFKSGDVYRYSNVPPEVYHDFLDARSKGKYFYANILGKYQYEKVS